MAKTKIQVLTDNEDEWNSKLWAFLEDHGFSVVTATERKSPRYKGHPPRKVSPGVNEGHNAETGENTTPQDLYEGTVRLAVVSDQRVRKMVNFVEFQPAQVE